MPRQSTRRTYREPRREPSRLVLDIDPCTHLITLSREVTARDDVETATLGEAVANVNTLPRQVCVRLARAYRAGGESPESLPLGALRLRLAMSAARRVMPELAMDLERLSTGEPLPWPASDRAEFYGQLRLPFAA